MAHLEHASAKWVLCTLAAATFLILPTATRAQTDVPTASESPSGEGNPPDHEPGDAVPAQEGPVQHNDAPADEPAVPEAPPPDPEGEGEAAESAPDGVTDSANDPAASDTPTDGEDPVEQGPPEADPAAPAIPVAPLEPGADADTGIQGTIVDASNGVPLELAPVLVQGGGKSRPTMTNMAGKYKINVPPGRYTVRSYYDFYHGARIDNVRVTRGKMTPVQLVLQSIDEEDDVEVAEIEIPYRADTSTAAAQDQMRKAAKGFGNGLGAEQMSKSGASDASDAAKGVVGVTVESSQLVIRGLGGRYTRVTLNGDAIPSVDPDRPGVDLDLFPTSVIESFNINKVFLPGMPGDFAGGVLDITTVTFPRKFMLELGVSTGGNTQSTFRERLTYDGGSTDFLGIDDGTRSMPSSVPDNEALRATSPFRPGSYKTRDSIFPIAREFNNEWGCVGNERPDCDLSRTSALPKIGLDGAVGDSFDLPTEQKSRFGYLVTASYGHNEKRLIGLTRPRPGLDADSNVVLRNNYKTERGVREVTLNSLGTASLDIGVNHSLTLLSMFNRSMEDQMKFRGGFSQDSSGPEEAWQLQFVARQLWFNQLLGRHNNLFGTPASLRWSAFGSLGNRQEPDRRSIVYGPRGDLFRWDDKSTSGERFYSGLDQKDYGARLSLRIPLWEGAYGTIGGRTRRSEREFSIRRMLMVPLVGPDQSMYAASPEVIFNEAGFGSLIFFDETTRPNDSYDAKQTLFAGFAELATPIYGPLSVAGGARLEVFKQDLLSASPFDDRSMIERNEENSLNQTNTNVLPGVALKYDLNDEMIVRGGYSATMGRAQVRELAPYQYYDFALDRMISGNPTLDPTAIQNFDLRWEWFFDEAQILAFSGFYKSFTDPIEVQILNSTTFDSQFINADSATSYGVEGELRINLEKINKVLKKFDFGTNFSLIKSTVELPPELSGAVRGSRPMFGQAPYVVNASLNFNDEGTRARAGLVYNVVGPRVVDAGARSSDQIYPDTREQPFHALNFVSSWGMTERLKLKFKVRNMLMSKRRFKMGDFLLRQIEPGLTVSLGLAYAY